MPAPSKRPSHSPRIVTLQRLSDRLGVGLDELNEWAERGDDGYSRFISHKGTKPRDIDNPLHRLKDIQRLINERLLRSMLTFPKHVRGGVRGQHIGRVGSVHVGKKYVVVVDVRKLYPSIHYERVLHFWTHDAECSPKVGRLLTRLTTCRSSLPTGAPTSLHIANLILSPIDQRIVGFCQERHLSYTRWVDDIVVSGDASPGMIESFVTDVLREHKLRVSGDKVRRLSITGDAEALIFKKIDVSQPRPRAASQYASDVLSETREAIGAIERLGHCDETEAICRRVLSRIGFIRLIQGRTSVRLRKAHAELRALRRTKKAEAKAAHPAGPH